MKIIRAIVALSSAICTFATHSLHAAPPDPRDATSKIPPLEYKSPFADHRKMGEDSRTPWKESNEKVGAGGGMGHSMGGMDHSTMKMDGPDAGKAMTEAPTTVDKSPPQPARAPLTPPTQQPPPQPAPHQHKHGG